MAQKNVKVVGGFLISVGFLFSQNFPIGEITDLGQPVSGVLNIWTVSGYDGRIYGGTSDGYPHSHLFYFDPQTVSFYDYGTLNLEVYSLTTGKDSLIYGGTYKTPAEGAHFFVFDPKEPWNPGVNPLDLGTPVFVPSGIDALIYDLVTTEDGKIYGGTGDAFSRAGYAYLFSYNPETNSFTNLGQPVLGEGSIFRLTEGEDGKIYGITRPNGYLFYYDPVTGNLTVLGEAYPGKSGGGITTGIDGKIYGASNPGGYLWVYDPLSVWNPGVNPEYIGNLNLPDGLWVLITGNNGRLYGGGGHNATFLEYDPRMAWDPGTADSSNPQFIAPAVPGENRIRSLTVGKDNFIYGGTAHTAHMFVFVPKPIFIAHFITPEREPFPFDVIISDGFWKQTFSQVTSIYTEIPVTATYTYSYKLIDGLEKIWGGRIELTISPGTSEKFDFYAWNLDSLIAPMAYIIFREIGDTLHLYWEWDVSTNTLHVYFSRRSDKHSGIGIPYIFEVDGERQVNPIIFFAPPDGTRVCWYYCPDQHMWLDYHHGNGEIRNYYGNVKFATIPQDWATVDIVHALYNDAIITKPKSDMWSLNRKLQMEEFISPRYAVPSGNYLLYLYPPSDEYLALNLPVTLLQNGMLGIDFLLKRKETLEPFTFSIGASHPFSNILYVLQRERYKMWIDISHIGQSQTWWGYFVLPDTLIVKDIFTYTDTTFYGLNYDYTIEHIANYNIVTVQIPWTAEKLSLTSGQSATVEIKPEVLNIKSNGRWITGYIELPEGYSVTDIDISTVELRYGRGKVKSETDPTEVGNYDNDGILDRMVKFDRDSVISRLIISEPPFDAELQLVGNLTDGTPFAGFDTISVISKGKRGAQSESIVRVPIYYSLSQNYPNPFTNATTIAYALPEDTYVAIEIYDVTGRSVKTLVNEYQTKGYKHIVWDGRDDMGRKMPEGVYFYRLETKKLKKMRKMIYLSK